MLVVVSLLAAAALLAVSPANGAPERATASSACSAKVKKKRTQALKAFQRTMAAKRKKFYKTHPSRKARALFRKRQQARLRQLKRAVAACSRPAPPRRPPAPPAPPPPGPAPPALPTFTADLAVSMSASTSEPQVNSTVTYTIVVQNLGTASAFGTVLSDPLSAGMRFVSAPGCSGLHTLTCGLDILGPGASRTVRVTLRPRQTGSLPNTVTVSTTSADRDAGNNTATVTVAAVPLPTYQTPAGPAFAHQLAKPAFADDTGMTFPPVGEWPKTLGVFQPGSGTLRGAVIFVDFPDAPGSGSISPEESLGLLRTDAQAWYQEASYGRMNLDLQSAGGWYRMSKPVADYGISACCSLPNVRAFVEEAITKADPFVDFSRYDAVWVIGPSNASPELSILIDQRWPGAGITVDGHELRRWITAQASYPSVPSQIEPARFSHWVVTHEIGHFLGLPDLYLKPPGCFTCPNTFEPVGFWDILSDVPLHAHFLAWHKWLLGWLDAAQIRGLTTSPGQLEVTLTPLAAPGGLKAVVVPLTPSTAYVVEVREPMGWESNLCDRGVLVYTVDSTKRNAEGPVHIKTAHPSVPGSPCGPIAGAAFDLGAGEVSHFADPSAGVQVDVLERLPDASYRVRVTKN
jgi:M6 family metalloprotease-like protein/uncharacterized repeat protein (TIGR01451 family)